MASEEQTRSSNVTLFGDAPSFHDIQRADKTIQDYITAPKFWYFFRKWLPYTATFAFLLFFIIPYIYCYDIDGAILWGGLLSFSSCLLVLLSYYHIVPWRRHPSAIMIFTSVVSLVISGVLIIGALPFLGYKNSTDSLDINYVGTSGYDSSHEHSNNCKISSFIVQFTLFAREFWIFTLTWDLVISITNPFASYQGNMNKYHVVVWLASLISGIVLINCEDCQGRFIKDGVCWIKIHKTYNWCFIGFFAGWMVLFYFISLLVLLFAYQKISKGLESTYATRYACVAATFRVVFFYIFYSSFMTAYFVVLAYLHNRNRISYETYRFLEHFYAYLTGCVGFFDSLVWFFSHGFNKNRSTESNKLIMRDIAEKALIFQGVKYLLKKLINCFCVLSSYCFNEKWRCSDDEQKTKYPFNTLYSDSDEENSPKDEDLTRGLLSDTITTHERFLPSHERTASTCFSDSRQTLEQLTETAATGGPTSKYHRFTDLDLSPQLNFALRAELLHAVTKGIKESVRKLQQRDFCRTYQQLLLHGESGVDLSFYAEFEEIDNFTEIPDEGSSDPVRQSLSSLGSSYVAELQASLGGESSFQNVVNTPVSVTPQSMKSRSSSSFRYSDNFLEKDNSTCFSRVWRSMMCFLYSIFGSHIPGEYGVDPSADDPLKMLLPQAVSTDSFIAQQEPDSPTNVELLLSPPILAAVQAYQTHREELRKSEFGQPRSCPNSPIRNSDPNKPRDISPRDFTNPTSYDDLATVSRSHRTRSMGEQKKQAHDLRFRSYSQGFIRRRNASISSDPPWNPKTTLQPIPPAAPAEVVFNLDEKHQFRDFRPATFRKLRQLSGVEEERYLELISQPTKERLSEGASGAFFFICGQGELIVKTVERSEAMALLEVLDKYVGYLSGHRESLLMRILGLHAIKMYSSDFHFVVLKNVFPPEVQLNEKYDIKGSWVNRHAKVRRPGKQSMCRYCNEVFIEGVGTNEQCPAVVGSHEAFMTLKDNDMINKLRLFPDHACNVLTILSRDSDALSDMGLTDYSLLVGVKNRQYDIDEIQQSAANQASNKFTKDSSKPTLTEPHLPFPTTTSIGSIERGDKYNYLKGDFNLHRRHTVDSTITSEANEHKSNPFGFPARSVIAPSAYYLGIVDILQTWSWRKQVERMFKVRVLGQSVDGISCMPPVMYRERFQRKMLNIIEHAGVVSEKCCSNLKNNDRNLMDALFQNQNNLKGSKSR